MLSLDLLIVVVFLSFSSRVKTIDLKRFDKPTHNKSYFDELVFKPSVIFLNKKPMPNHQRINIVNNQNPSNRMSKITKSSITTSTTTTSTTTTSTSTKTTTPTSKLTITSTTPSIDLSMIHHTNTLKPSGIPKNELQQTIQNIIGIDHLTRENEQQLKLIDECSEKLQKLENEFNERSLHASREMSDWFVVDDLDTKINLVPSRELDSQEETLTHLPISLQNYGNNQMLLDIRKNLVDYLK